MYKKPRCVNIEFCEFYNLVLISYFSVNLSEFFDDNLQ